MISVSQNLNAQTTYYWVGGTTATDPGTTSNWNTVLGGGGSPPASVSNANIFIVDGSDVSSTAGLQTGTVQFSMGRNRAVGKLVLQNGATVTVASSSGTRTLTIGNLTGVDFQVDAGCTITQNSGATIKFTASSSAELSGTHSVTSGTGRVLNLTSTTFTIKNGGNLSITGTLTISSTTFAVESGGTFTDNRTSALIPTGTWDPNSTVEIKGYTSETTTPTGITQALGNLVWNCASQTSTVPLNSAMELHGSLIVTTTSSGTLLVTNSATSRNIIVHGNLSIAAGTLNLGSSSGNGTINLRGDFTMTGGTLTETGSTTASGITFDSTVSQTFTKSAGTISGALLFTVASGATVDFQSILDGASGTFTNSGTMIINHASGITSSGATGQIQTTGTRTYNTNANYHYTGTSSQVFGAGLPSTVNNLLVNNGNTNMSLPATTVNGTLTISSGSLVNMGSNALSGASLLTSGTGVLRTQNTTSTPIPAGRTWSFKVQFDNTSGTQTIPGGTYTKINLANTSGIQTAGGNFSVSDSLEQSGGTLDMATNDLSGAFVASGTGTFTTQSTSTTPYPSNVNWPYTVTINGSANQTVRGGTYTTLNISNANTASLKSGENATVSTNLNLSSGKFDLNGNTLTLNGDFNGTSTNCLVGSATSNLTIGGSGALSSNLFFAQTAASDSGLFNLTINRSSQTITLGSKLKLFGTLTPTAGTLATGGNLVLASTSSGTARISSGACTTCSYISGNVTVQRFIPSVSRSWRFLAANVSSRTFADWQNEIHITGTGGASNGFDATSTNYPSIYSYDETATGNLNQGWTAPTSTSNSIVVGKGYRVFIRGTRDSTRLNGNNSTQDAVTLDLVGAVNTGDQILSPTFTSNSGSADDGWNLLGNPYPCEIDWNNYYDNFSSNYSNIDPTVYIYDPNFNQYSSFNALSNVGLNAMSGNSIIPSGAAFFVKANAASPTLKFTETCKSNGTSPAVFKTGGPEVFTITLMGDSVSRDQMALIYNENAASNKDQYDIIKMYGANVNIASMTEDGSFLALNSKPFNGSSDTVKLSLGFATSGDYTLDLQNAGAWIPDSCDGFFIDKFTGDKSNLLETGAYSFNVDLSNAATFGNERFMLVIAKQIADTTGDTTHNALIELNRNQYSGKLKIYPVATNDYTTLSSDSKLLGKTEIVLFNSTGMRVMSLQPNFEQGKINLDLTAIKPGLYYIQTQTNRGTYINKVVKY